MGVHSDLKHRIFFKRTNGFKLFTGLFCIKYILMAAFDIHLLFFKNRKPNEVREKGGGFGVSIKGKKYQKRYVHINIY